MSQTGNELLHSVLKDLRGAGVDDALKDARHLLAFALGLPMDRLTLHLDDPVSPEAVGKFLSAVEARVSRKPVSQITQSRIFWGREFVVTSDVLDPRPETEILIEQALACDFSRVLDLGTGSGCILLSLLAERACATGLGADNSVEALAIAQKNATRLELSNRAEFHQSDWFSSLQGRFDLIVANPPYIRLSEMEGLSPEVRLWEPMAALTPGPEGLEAYKMIAAGLKHHLAKDGRAMFEIGPDQASDVVSIFRAVGMSDVRVHNDLDGRDRVVTMKQVGE